MHTCKVTFTSRIFNQASSFSVLGKIHNWDADCRGLFPVKYIMCLIKGIIYANNSMPAVNINVICINLH